MVSYTTEELQHFTILRSIAIALGIIPCFIGSCVGLRECVIGVCQASEISLELSLTILPFAFTSAPTIYSLIVFFIFTADEGMTDVRYGYRLCLAGALIGAGGFLSGYSVGGICRHGVVTRATQKKFKTQFLVMLVFAELIGIFALIVMFAAKNIEFDKELTGK